LFPLVIKSVSPPCKVLYGAEDPLITQVAGGTITWAGPFANITFAANRENSNINGAFVFAVITFFLVKIENYLYTKDTSR
jgi:hypothetical protein